MRITLTIDTENDAFKPRPDRELTRILRRLAAQIDAAGRLASLLRSERGGEKNILDVNGNTVGKLTITAADNGV